MVIFLQRTFTSLVNAHVGRTQNIQLGINRAAVNSQTENYSAVNPVNIRVKCLNLFPIQLFNSSFFLKNKFTLVCDVY
jgi:hypothetical protein